MKCTSNFHHLQNYIERLIPEDDQNDGREDINIDKLIKLRRKRNKGRGRRIIHDSTAFLMQSPIKNTVLLKRQKLENGEQYTQFNIPNQNIESPIIKPTAVYASPLKQNAPQIMKETYSKIEQITAELKES